MAYVIKCHKMTKNGILWHFITYAIRHKCHQVLIRRIDLKAVESFSRNKILHKTQKSEIAIFPLYFLGVSFIIFNEFVGGSNDIKIKKSFFSWPIHMMEHKNPEGQKIWTIFTIFTPPYCTCLLDIFVFEASYQIFL